MKIIFHGIDLVDSRRIERLVHRHGRRFLDRVFTPAEQQYSGRHRKQAERLAGRFAVKEAVMKMLGTGWSKDVGWKDIETLNSPSGKPEVILRSETAKKIADQMGIESISVSITHTSDLAIASAIALGN
jgi:holo-[acyl-carrier protein] synthase